MQYIQIQTLVDITATKPSREDTDQFKIAQQSNFNSLMQAIGMRSNVEYRADPAIETVDDNKMWVWNFQVERDGVFTKGNDPVGLLKDDIAGVPIIANLSNTAKINPAVFMTQGDKQNTWVFNRY